MIKSSSKLKIGVILVLLIVFFAVLNLTNLSRGIKNSFYSASMPIEKKLWRAGDSVSDFFAGIFAMKDLKKEVDELRLKNQELFAEIVALNEIKKENETLRAALSIGLEKEFQLTLAQVVSKDISKDSILIDKGLKNGITKNLPVITSQKILLGRIGEVYEDFSEVILVSSQESSFDVKVISPSVLPEEDETSVYGVAKGKGNLEIYLDLIPKDKEISEGDFIVTAALGGIFPPGLLAGIIKKIKKSDAEPFQTAEVSSAFNLGELDKLFVITNFNPGLRR